jgi:zona occludens toxin
MISAYTGLPGSGKSYNVVEHVILPALREGRTVVSNLPMHEDRLAEAIPDADFRSVTLERIRDTPSLIDELCPPGAVCVFDELWRLWPAGEKVNRIPEEFKSFLAEHRHRVDKEGRSMQIVLVTQDLAQVAAFARQLVEQTLIHTKLGHLGAKGSFKVNICHGAVTGLVAPESRGLTTRLGKYKPEVFRFYRSHTMSESGKEGADESAIDQRGNIWKRPGLIAMGLLGLACLGFGGNWVYGVTKDPASAVGGTVGDRPQPTRPQSGHPVGPVTQGVEVARRWRVSGYLLGDRESSRVLITDGVVSRWLPFHSYCRQERTGDVACDVNGRKVSTADFPL